MTDKKSHNFNRILIFFCTLIRKISEESYTKSNTPFYVLFFLKKSMYLKNRLLIGKVRSKHCTSFMQCHLGQKQKKKVNL